LFILEGPPQHTSSSEAPAVSALLIQTSVLTKITYYVFLTCRSLLLKNRELFCPSRSSHPFFLMS